MKDFTLTKTHYHHEYDEFTIEIFKNYEGYSIARISVGGVHISLSKTELKHALDDVLNFDKAYKFLESDKMQEETE